MVSFAPGTEPFGHGRDPQARRVHLRSRTAHWVGACFVTAAILGAPACKRETISDAPTKTKSDGQVLLQGHFQAVTKAATGSVEIVRKGEAYELRLTGVNVQAKGPVHVYLVGLPAATSTLAVDEVELKYDMAELIPNQPEQRIELPSEPNPALRSVVLWDPKYGANLASASLAPVK